MKINTGTIQGLFDGWAYNLGQKNVVKAREFFAEAEDLNLGDDKWARLTSFVPAVKDYVQAIAMYKDMNPGMKVISYQLPVAAGVFVGLTPQHQINDGAGTGGHIIFDAGAGRTMMLEHYREEGGVDCIVATSGGEVIAESPRDMYEAFKQANKPIVIHP